MILFMMRPALLGGVVMLARCQAQDTAGAQLR
ncbi:hypothetical protein GGQ81_000902 [Sphingomonas desiccabilis]|nr:hypothetical protein [Sphingomonas desiccabilis]